MPGIGKIATKLKSLHVHQKKKAAGWIILDKMHQNNTFA